MQHLDRAVGGADAAQLEQRLGDPESRCRRPVPATHVGRRITGRSTVRRPSCRWRPAARSSAVTSPERRGRRPGRLRRPGPLRRSLGDDLAEVEHRQLGAHAHHQGARRARPAGCPARPGPTRSAGCRTPRSRTRRGPRRARRAAAPTAGRPGPDRARPGGPDRWAARRRAGRRRAWRASRSRISSTSSAGAEVLSGRPGTAAPAPRRRDQPRRISSPTSTLSRTRERREHLEALERAADARAGPLMGAEPGDVAIAEADRARGRSESRRR